MKNVTSAKPMLRATVSVFALLFWSSAAMAETPDSVTSDNGDVAIAVDDQTSGGDVGVVDGADGAAGDEADNPGEAGEDPSGDGETGIDPTPPSDDLNPEDGDDAGDDDGVIMIDDPIFIEDPMFDEQDPVDGDDPAAGDDDPGQDASGEPDGGDVAQDGSETDGTGIDNPEIYYMSGGPVRNDGGIQPNQRSLGAGGAAHVPSRDHDAAQTPDQCSFGGKGLFGLCQTAAP